MGKAMPERTIKIAKLLVTMTFCWPPPATASRFKVILFKVTRFILGCSAMLFLLPLVNAIYKYRHDPVNMVTSVCLTSAAVQIVLQTIWCARQYTPLQMLIAELEEYCKTAESWKRDVLQRYSNNCGRFYIAAVSWVYFNSTLCCVAPFILTDDQFPTNAEYPFAITSTSLRAIIYFHQTFANAQVAGHVSLNTFVALMLWYAVARFEILATEMEDMKNAIEMRALIRMHQNLIMYDIGNNGFTDRVIVNVRCIALITMLACFVSLVANGLTLLIPTSIQNKIQFGVLNVTALLEVFMVAWPADRLINMYEGIANGLYGSEWFNLAPNDQKAIQYVIMRTRKPAVITVKCILPPMNLEYFASFVSAALSYFMTLRIMIQSDD